MQYDPIKKSLGGVFNKTPLLRILFYKLLDLLLLRAWYVRREIKRWAKDLSRHEGRRCAILDAGSGFGQYTYFLTGLNPLWFVDAVDVKEEQIADCNDFFTRINRNNVLFEKADLTSFIKPDKFDLILSVDVMEHIADDEKVFRNFYDSLTQQGMLLISTPSDQGGSDVHDHEDSSSFIDEHVRDGYNMSDIRGKLESAGFTNTEAYYTYGAPGKTGWRLSMKYPILMLNTSRLFFILLPIYYIIVYPIAFFCNWLDTCFHHKSGTGLIVKAWK
ncbi:MAG: class I SAM-dependent methyltransferase [Bacteroidales bacterium]|jgi:SAM-dependent methyltransferase|nr:class I SAM-dependent methyltransferase [Bacteroidales bacterium]